jgi:hypothetical protein
MERFDSMPREAAEGWLWQDVAHPAGEQMPFHYHDIEELLEVTLGALRFVTPGGREFSVTRGQALRIPPGEVHRVDIGPEAASYHMWTPREERDGAFPHRVSEELLTLLKDNLALPDVENRWERRNRARPSQEDGDDEAFLLNMLLGMLIFRTAKGLYLDRGQYLRRPQPEPAIVRSTSGSIQVIHETSDTALLSTVVETSRSNGARASSSNVRLFVKEEGAWKCRVWLNSPEPSV